MAGAGHRSGGVAEKGGGAEPRGYRDTRRHARRALRQQVEELAEALVLPSLQLLATALNFVLILVSSRPAFELPIRVLYPDPAVAVRWERDVPRDRVRMWTVDDVVMRGWR